RTVPEASERAAPALQVLAVRIEQQPRIPPLRRQDLPRQDLHQVRLAHPRGGEDADVRGERVPADADVELDRVLTASQEPDAQIAHPLAEEGEVVGPGRRDFRELRRQRLQLAELPTRVDIAEGGALRDLVEPLL